jgi:hypothetical protein
MLTVLRLRRVPAAIGLGHVRSFSLFGRVFWRLSFLGHIGPGYVRPTYPGRNEESSPDCYDADVEEDAIVAAHRAPPGPRAGDPG